MRLQSAVLAATLVLALALALAFGAAARWLRLPPLFGYLLAGVVISPHTPGFVGDAGDDNLWPLVALAAMAAGGLGGTAYLLAARRRTGTPVPALPAPLVAAPPRPRRTRR